MKHLITLAYLHVQPVQHITEIHYQCTENQIELTLRNAELWDYREPEADGIIDYFDKVTRKVEYDSGLSLKENLFRVITQVIEESRFTYGIPSLEKPSDIVTEEDWNHILDELQKKTETNFNSDLLEFLREQRLDPEPYDVGNGMWTAYCASRRGHSMMINAISGQFGCGWCRRKGGIDELRQWIDEKKTK